MPGFPGNSAAGTGHRFGESTMTARIQHTVWKHYLKPWTDKNGRLRCLRNGNIFSAKPRRVMAERDFYEVDVLTDEEVRALEWWFDDATPGLKEEIFAMISTLDGFAEFGERAQQLNNLSEADKKRAASARIAALETFHSTVEREVLPTLRALVSGSTDFLQDEHAASRFFLYIALQYFRTKKIRESLLSSRISRSPFDIRGIVGLIAFCTAFQFGANLFLLRNGFDIVFLENESSLGLITGDQPIVNVSGTLGGNARVPEELVLYYPLTPHLALVYAEKKHKLESQPVGQSVVKMLNDHMAVNSHENLVASHCSALVPYVGSHVPSVPSHIEILQCLRPKAGHEIS